jgi:lipoyl(octanoyl) transferase
MTARPICKVRPLGRIDYPDALAMQEGMVGLRREDKIPDTLLLVEHPHVVTKGSGASEENILVDAAESDRLGLQIFETSRGGDVTYHGPGQIVGYPILQLRENERDAHAYLRRLEEMLMAVLADYGIESTRHPDYTGVWVGERKVAAIGVRLSKWITSHGFALNVNPDLTYFDTIVPCGIEEKGVTSMGEILGRSPAIHEVEERIVERFGEIFQRRMQRTVRAS